MVDLTDALPRNKMIEKAELLIMFGGIYTKPCNVIFRSEPFFISFDINKKNPVWVDSLWGLNLDICVAKSA